MSTEQTPGADSTDQNSTPLLQPPPGQAPGLDGDELESEPATMDPVEAARMRRDVELELENYEQGMQG